MSRPGRDAELCPGVRVLVTDRSGGVSTGPFASLNVSFGVGDDSRAVTRNRDIVLAVAGAGRLSWMRQVHGAAVVRDDDAQVADAIFTGAPGAGLAVQVADCAPVLVADPVAGLAGAAHAGRPGLAAGVVPALVAAMMAAGRSQSGCTR